MTYSMYTRVCLYMVLSKVSQMLPGSHDLGKSLTDQLIKFVLR